MRRCLLLLVAVPLHGQIPDNVREHLDRLTTTDSVPSIAVAVARDGAIVWENAFGWADREHHVRATPRTAYAVASVTKTFTATELLILRGEHRLDLERPANAYLAGLPDSVRVTSPAWNAEQVTVHRLATHTAGLPTHYLFCFTGTPNCEVSTPQAIARYAIAIRLPGERFDYSNLGYGVLGAIIERVTGRPLRAVMRDDVFAPLGLDDTFIGPAGSRPGVAASYAGNGTRVDGYHSTTPAASDGYASVHDLARFGLFHLHGGRHVLPDSVIDWMQNVTVPFDGRYRYGFGWWVEPDHFGDRDVYAAGGTTESSAMLLLVPKEHLVVAIATNTGFSLSGIADDIVAAYVPTFAARRARGPDTPAVIQAKRPVSSLVGTWVGHIATYRGRVPLEVRIDSLGDARVTVGHAAPTSIANVSFTSDGRVEGTFAGALPVDEYHGRQYHLETELAVHGMRLTGYVTAVLEPNALEGIGLSYWVDLAR
jgi:CubicO group peptidase (beta-lactamase class C family)